MTPIGQTLLTMGCMLLAFWWGYREGKQKGIETAVIFFEDNDMFKDGVIEYEDEEEDDE